MRIRPIFDRQWLEEFAARVRADSPWDPWELFRLAYEAAEATLVPSFDDLECLKHLHAFSPLPHQVETARRVVNEMRGRAILADEVGLGKTIEAGLVLKEYLVRGLVKKALILVPSSLVTQWTAELNQKFAIPAVAQKKAYMWRQHDILVASLDTAKRAPHREQVLDIAYDMLIVDEAHKLKNARTQNWAFVNAIKKKYCLLLTATPVQNDLHELFNMISLLKPGHLGNDAAFAHQYVVHKRLPKNEEKLRTELGKVMIRNRRADGGIAFTERRVETLALELSPKERELYDAVTAFVREQAQETRSLRSAFALLTLQREVCSSRDAAMVSLFKWYKRAEEGTPLKRRLHELLLLAKEVGTHTKARKVVELLRRLDGKVILFTEYRATQEFLQAELAKQDITTVLFRGGFGRNKKDWMRMLFENRARVLIATEAGGEGINLQFCHQMINYDLPWNPMRVEQRIGRIHRLGQTRDVTIFNLATKDTIEEHILNLLTEKIRLFELVVGELDAIVTQVHLSKTFDRTLADIVLRSKDDREAAEKLRRLGDALAQARETAGPGWAEAAVETGR